MKFEWDTTKARSNLSKHGISFIEAQTIFDRPILETFDAEHSSDAEDRFTAIGISDNLQFLSLAYTIIEGRTPRLISARKSTKSEINAYIRAHS